MAKAGGYAGRSSVQRYFDPEFDDDASHKVWRRLADAMAANGVEREAVWAVSGLPPENAVPVPLAEALAVPAPRRLPDNVPVYGTALGTLYENGEHAIEQTSLNESEVVAYFKRPPALDGRRDVYGVFIQGGSMAPRWEDGDIAYVDPKRPARIGDDVVVFMRDHDEHDGERVVSCLIKRLVKRTASFLELEQFTPATTFRVPIERVAKTHRVIPWGEMLS